MAAHPDLKFTVIRSHSMPTVRMALREAVVTLSPSQLVALHYETGALIGELTAEVNHLTGALEREARNRARNTDAR